MMQIESNEDLEFEDETIAERFLALSEMFPEPLRDITCSAYENTTTLSKTLFSWTKSGIWVLATSFTILIFPIIVETERSTIEEQQSMQQRQLLLGPSAAQTASSAQFGYPK